MSDSAEEIGKRIRERRVERRLEQTDLAKAAGVSVATVSAIENGHTDTRLSILVGISQALKCDPAALLSAPIPRLNGVSRLSILGGLIAALAPLKEEELRAAADHLAALGLIESAADAGQAKKLSQTK